MLIQYKPLESEMSLKLDKVFGKRDIFIRVEPGNAVMPRKYTEIADQILDFKVRPDDTWLVSYPRTGSTWAQEMVWLLGNNLDYDGAKQLQVARSPLLELTAIFFEDHKDWLEKTCQNSVEMVNKLSSPRFIKSHLPLQLLPRELSSVKPKLIYTSRNPKDLCVSFYYYCKLVHDLTGTFEEFCDIFLSGHAPIGDVATHMLAFWRMRNEPNVLFLKYEDMKRDLGSIIRQCAAFLNNGVQLTDEDIAKMVDYLDVQKMQKNPAVNLEPILGTEELDKKGVKFIRKGQIGDWKNYMDSEMSARFDAWILEKFGGTGLEFEYE